MAEKTESAFRLQYKVQTFIKASPAHVWAKLTDANQFNQWNSTVTSIEGPIALGQRLAITVPVAPGRVFRPKVVRFVPDQIMVWRDGFLPPFRGTRTFTLVSRNGGVDFDMTEVFEGLALPFIKGSLPDFGPIFDRYAADLKRACETA
jgi:uncharacterized protein YndB with AHSA1/START domain